MRAWTVTHEGRGTRYRLVLYSDGAPGVRGVAWPDSRWSIGDLSTHGPPAAGWLASMGLREGDAEEIAAVLAREWSSTGTGAGAAAPLWVKGAASELRELAWSLSNAIASGGEINTLQNVQSQIAALAESMGRELNA